MGQQLGKMPSTRQLRVSEQVKQVLNEIFIQGSFNDRDLKKAIVSINEVKISPDLKNATAYVSIIGEKYPHKAIKALNKADAYFKKEMSRKLNLKYTPKINFRADDVMDYAEKIENLLSGIHVKED
ncbi:MAG: 30S ribosome-binding factor RbfA [Alphaproteobacteria bacterium]|jgi:ribosome-binding factor A|nr:30S ribosome-binding factor RbfA [Alphaproteobacteria bacterium]MCV6599036.1 30S ribosome-binding factor RbfA [Alphaproteobacteria bacterium]